MLPLGHSTSAVMLSLSTMKFQSQTTAFFFLQSLGTCTTIFLCRQHVICILKKMCTQEQAIITAVLMMV